MSARHFLKNKWKELDTPRKNASPKFNFESDEITFSSENENNEKLVFATVSFLAFWSVKILSIVILVVIPMDENFFVLYNEIPQCLKDQYNPVKQYFSSDPCIMLKNHKCKIQVNVL